MKLPEKIITAILLTMIATACNQSSTDVLDTNNSVKNNIDDIPVPVKKSIDSLDKYTVTKQVIENADAVLLITINNANLTPGSHPVWMLHIDYSVNEVIQGKPIDANPVSFWINVDTSWKPKNGDHGILIMKSAREDEPPAIFLYPATDNNLKIVSE